VPKRATGRLHPSILPVRASCRSDGAAAPLTFLDTTGEDQYDVLAPKGVGVSMASSRTIITMACTECQERNYSTVKNKKNDNQRLEMRKFCPVCGQHRLHRETR
jgi:large subunit ribosomal protein L33